MERTDEYSFEEYADKRADGERTGRRVLDDIGLPCKCPVCGEPFPDRLAYVDHRMRSCFLTIM